MTSVTAKIAISVLLKNAELHASNPPACTPYFISKAAVVHGVFLFLQVVFHGMLFAFIYLALQKRQVLSEGKGEPLFSNRMSNFLLFISVVSFLVSFKL